MWESNYESVRFGNFCNIRAPFHETVDDVTFDLVIEPKMSFGTAHHETTALMIKHLEHENLSNKRVLDMGCGTGILAIIAAKKGASEIVGIDNDLWAYENSIENAERNNVNNIKFFHGDANNLKDMVFDVIIANINRNILINDMSAYASSLESKGVLFLSGFYEHDLSAIVECCKNLSIKYDTHLSKNNWVAARFINQK